MAKVNGFSKVLAAVVVMVLALTVFSTSVLAEGMTARRPLDGRKTNATVPGSLYGQVYQDWDLNGQRDAEEPGLAEAVLVVRDSENREVARQITTADGTYQIEGLRAGTYSVSVQLPEGYSLTQESAQTINLSARATSEANFATALLMR
jgi:hypothetical protein